jgi:hypothetical protein
VRGVLGEERRAAFRPAEATDAAGTARDLARRSAVGRIERDPTLAAAFERFDPAERLRAALPLEGRQAGAPGRRDVARLRQRRRLDPPAALEVPELDLAAEVDRRQEVRVRALQTDHERAFVIRRGRHAGEQPRRRLDAPHAAVDADVRQGRAEVVLE